MKPLASAGRFVKEQANVAVRFVRDRVAPQTGAPTVDDVPNGEGRVVDVDGDRCAVYRDGAGQLHVHSAVCSHAGCIVQWNAVADTWDCPCHGGCFTPHGGVIGGPPVRGLAKLPPR